MAQVPQAGCTRNLLAFVLITICLLLIGVCSPFLYLHCPLTPTGHGLPHPGSAGVKWNISTVSLSLLKEDCLGLSEGGLLLCIWHLINTLN